MRDTTNITSQNFVTVHRRTHCFCYFNFNSKCTQALQGAQRHMHCCDWTESQVSIVSTVRAAPMLGTIAPPLSDTPHTTEGNHCVELAVWLLWHSGTLRCRTNLCLSYSCSHGVCVCVCWWYHNCYTRVWYTYTTYWLAVYVCVIHVHHLLVSGFIVVKLGMRYFRKH